MKTFRFASDLVALIFALVILLQTKPAKSYLVQHLPGNGTVNRARWDFSAFPVQWSINPTASNVTGGAQIQDVIATSFATWIAAPNTSISVSRAADSQTTGPAYDGINLICFTCVTDFNSDGTLAVTFTTTADGVGADDKHGGRSRFGGQILDADILFNPAVKFTTDGSGNSDRWFACAF